MSILKVIENDIKSRSFKRAYLIYGEEDYLVKKYTGLLKNNIVSEDNAVMNTEVFEGNDCNVDKIIGAGDTAPFFSDYRLVVISNSGLFKDGRKADSTEIAEAVKNIPEDCVYLFTNEKVDKRNILYKAVKKLGTAVKLTIRILKVLQNGLKKNQEEGLIITRQITL